MAILNNQQTANNYTQANSIERFQAKAVNLDVYNAAVFVSIIGPNGEHGEEIFKPPGSYIFNRRCSGARVRSGALNTPARFTLEMVPV